VIIVMGPIAGRLADRLGSRPLMTAGLLLVATALGIQSRMSVHTGYGLILPGFILMGLGMGLVMSPMSTAAMNSVDRTKAGAASGVLSMCRMVGGTFGIAIMGALVATIGRSDVTSSLPGLPAHVRAQIANGLGSGSGLEHLPRHVVAVVDRAFVSALGTGLTVTASVAVVGAVIAFSLIRRTVPKRSAVLAPTAEPVATPVEITA
jgi:MFS family permease